MGIYKKGGFFGSLLTLYLHISVDIMSIMSKEMQKSKMAVWGGLTNSCEKKRRKNKGEKERYKHLNAEFQRTARRDKKAFLSDQGKKNRGKQQNGKD